MVRTTDADDEADIKTDGMSTDALADYINRTAPVAAKLSDDDPAADVIRANVRVAVDAFRSRYDTDKTTVADGGSEVADIVDDWGAYVDDTDMEFKIRHSRTVSTEVRGDAVVHTVVEDYADDAPVAALSFCGRARCPVDDHSTQTTSSDDDGVVRHNCRHDDCPFEATVGYRRRDDSTTTAPAFFRAVVPHDAVDTSADFDPDEYDNETDHATLLRALALEDFTGCVNDASYVSAEWDGNPVADDDAEKTADAYIDTVDCSRCDDTTEPVNTSEHAHFGTVCSDCADASVWSPEDADLPDDVEARMSEHKTFDTRRIVRYLVDAAYHGDFVAAVSDDDVDADATLVKTGKGGKVGTVPGAGRAGTGFRRPNGPAHNEPHFRTTLRDLVDTGLLTRVDEADTDVDDPNATWEITDKGVDVLSSLARCRTCGGSLSVSVRSTTYTSGRRSEQSTSLVTDCEACRASTDASFQHIDDI